MNAIFFTTWSIKNEGDPPPLATQIKDRWTGCITNNQPTAVSWFRSKKKDTTDLFRFQGKQIIILSAGLFTHQVMKINFKYSNALVIIQCSGFDKNQLNHWKGSSLLRQFIKVTVICNFWFMLIYAFLIQPTIQTEKG